MENSERNRLNLVYTLKLFVVCSFCHAFMTTHHPSALRIAFDACIQGLTDPNANPDRKHPTPKTETRVRVAPLLICVRKLKQFAVISIRNNGKHIEQIYTALDLCYKIFYSLNWLEPPEQFTDNLDEWMLYFFGALRSFLEGAKNPVHRFLEDDDDDDTVSLQTKLLATVINNAKLFVWIHNTLTYAEITTHKFTSTFSPLCHFVLQVRSKAR